MSKDLFMPQYKIEDQTNNTALVLLKFSSNLEVFDGHFPDFSITPGVVLFHVVVVLSEEVFDLSKRPMTVPRVKFLRPIISDQEISLQLLWDEEKGILNFKYFSSNHIFNTGSLKFESGE